jgi:hypothetical protein
LNVGKKDKKMKRRGVEEQRRGKIKLKVKCGDGERKRKQRKNKEGKNENKTKKDEIRTASPPQRCRQQTLARPQHASHPESDVQPWQPFVPPMPIPPMLGRDHHSFLLEVQVEGVLGVRVSVGLRKMGRGWRSGGGDQERERRTGRKKEKTE